MPNVYPREFRDRAVELVRVSGRPTGQIAKELGVSTTGLQRWPARRRSMTVRDRESPLMIAPS